MTTDFRNIVRCNPAAEVVIMSVSEDDSLVKQLQTSDSEVVVANNNDVSNDINYSTCVVNNNINKTTSSSNNNNNTLFDNTPEYLAQLLSDKKKLQSFSGLFVHLEKLLDEEIGKVRKNLFHLVPDMLNSQRLPEPLGPLVTLSERLTVPVNDYPDYNFVGRILGPRGRTAKQLEQDMDCKIMIRGKGSTRNASKDPGKQKQNQEHMAEELHVLVTVEDAENRAKTKLEMAVEQVKKLLVPAPEGEDSLKRKQLMELAIINGTYRETKSLSSSSSSLSPVSSSSPSNTPQIINNSQIFGRAQMTLQRPQQTTGLLSPTLANGAPIILTSARLPHVPMQTPSGTGLLEGHPLINPAAFINTLEQPQGGILVQIDSNGLLQPAFFDLGYSIDTSQAGPLRRSRVCIRDQPYLR